jgi:hypothetical protein
MVHAPADTVYRYIADMREHHPRFLPEAFSEFRVESGGVGADTITRFTLKAGERSREYRMTVAEPGPGRIPDRVRHRFKRGHHVHGLPAGRRVTVADLHRVGWRWRHRRPVRAESATRTICGRAQAARCLRA